MDRAKAMWRWLGTVAALASSAAAAAEDAVLFDGRTVAGIVHDGSSSAKLVGKSLTHDLKELIGRVATVAGMYPAAVAPQPTTHKWSHDATRPFPGFCRSFISSAPERHNEGR